MTNFMNGFPNQLVRIGVTADAVRFGIHLYNSLEMQKLPDSVALRDIIHIMRLVDDDCLKSWVSEEAVAEYVEIFRVSSEIGKIIKTRAKPGQKFGDVFTKEELRALIQSIPDRKKPNLTENEMQIDYPKLPIASYETRKHLFGALIPHVNFNPELDERVNLFEVENQLISALQRQEVLEQFVRDIARSVMRTKFRATNAS